MSLSLRIVFNLCFVTRRLVIGHKLQTSPPPPFHVNAFAAKQTNPGLTYWVDNQLVVTPWLPLIQRARPDNRNVSWACWTRFVLQAPRFVTLLCLLLSYGERLSLPNYIPECNLREEPSGGYSRSSGFVGHNNRCYSSRSIAGFNRSAQEQHENNKPLLPPCSY